MIDDSIRVNEPGCYFFILVLIIERMFGIIYT